MKLFYGILLFCLLTVTLGFSQIKPVDSNALLQAGNAVGTINWPSVILIFGLLAILIIAIGFPIYRYMFGKKNKETDKLRRSYDYNYQLKKDIQTIMNKLTILEKTLDGTRNQVNSLNKDICTLTGSISTLIKESI